MQYEEIIKRLENIEKKQDIIINEFSSQPFNEEIFNDVNAHIFPKKVKNAYDEETQLYAIPYKMTINNLEVWTSIEFKPAKSQLANYGILSMVLENKKYYPAEIVKRTYKKRTTYHIQIRFKDDYNTDIIYIFYPYQEGDIQNFDNYIALLKADNKIT